MVLFTHCAIVQRFHAHMHTHSHESLKTHCHKAHRVLPTPPRTFFVGRAESQLAKETRQKLLLSISGGVRPPPRRDAEQGVLYGVTLCKIFQKLDISKNCSQMSYGLIGTPLGFFGTAKNSQLICSRDDKRASNRL